MENISLRRATIEDSEILLDLMQRQFSEHKIECQADALNISVREIFLREGLGFFVVATKVDRVVGFAAISFAWTFEHGGEIRMAG